MNELQMLAGCAVGFSVVGLVVLLTSRRMLMVHGIRRQYKAGFLWAVCSLIRMYFFGFSNTLFVNPNCIVKTRQENREMRKNRPAKCVMIFEAEL
jgi:hypothetical protein